jgi:hypothetical protein
MTDPFLEKVYTRKLAHAYVALALAQDEAKRYVSDYPPTAHGVIPFLVSLNITAELLEEVLEKVLPEADPTDSQTMNCSEMLM